MSKKFINEILGESVEDKEMEVLVQAWMIYHQTADNIDGHIKAFTGYQNEEERNAIYRAAIMGANARNKYLQDHGLDAGVYILNKRDPKWTRANLEALRRLEG